MYLTEHDIQSLWGPHPANSDVEQPREGVTVDTAHTTAPRIVRLYKSRDQPTYTSNELKVMQRALEKQIYVGEPTPMQLKERQYAKAYRQRKKARAQEDEELYGPKVPTEEERKAKLKKKAYDQDRWLARKAKRTPEQIAAEKEYQRQKWVQRKRKRDEARGTSNDASTASQEAPNRQHSTSKTGSPQLVDVTSNRADTTSRPVSPYRPALETVPDQRLS